MNTILNTLRFVPLLPLCACALGGSPSQATSVVALPSLAPVLSVNQAADVEGHGVATIGSAYPSGAQVATLRSRPENRNAWREPGASTWTDLRSQGSRGESSSARVPVEEGGRPVPVEPGTYLRLNYGVGTLLDGDLDRTSGGATTSGDGSYDQGFLSGLAVGYRIDPAWSVEGEFMYRSNDLDRWESGGATLAGDGDFASLSLMVNLRHHFDVTGNLRPYLGLGLGLVEEIDVDVVPTGTTTETSFSDQALGLQAMVGVDWLLSRNWSLSAEARYFTAVGFDLEGEGPNAGTSFDGDYNHLSALVGLTYSF